MKNQKKKKRKKTTNNTYKQCDWKDFIYSTFLLEIDIYFVKLTPSSLKERKKKPWSL